MKEHSGCQWSSPGFQAGVGGATTCTGRMPGIGQPAFGKHITRWPLFAKEFTIDFDSNKISVELENWNSFLSLISILINVDK